MLWLDIKRIQKNYGELREIASILWIMYVGEHVNMMG